MKKREETMTVNKVKLFEHQLKALELTKDKHRVAYYLDMGLGKTFVGSEKMKLLGENLNIIVCQKSKIEDWYEHIKTYYPFYNVIKYNKQVEIKDNTVLIINYDLLWRRPELLKLKDFTLMLDESSYIKNETSKRSKFILKMKAKNVILLSGTPISGKYEELWSQCKLLGWDITKTTFWNTYIKFKLLDVGGFKIKKITGYKNVERLKRKLREYGSVFMKTEDVFDLPKQIDIEVKVDNTKIYKMFKKDRLYIHDDIELVGDTTLTKMLYERKLCSIYNPNKFNQLKALLESTNDRIIIFYNFKEEYNQILKSLCSMSFAASYSFISGPSSFQFLGLSCILPQTVKSSMNNGRNKLGMLHKLNTKSTIGIAPSHLTTIIPSVFVIMKYSIITLYTNIALRIPHTKK